MSIVAEDSPVIEKTKELCAQIVMSERMAAVVWQVLGTIRAGSKRDQRVVVARFSGAAVGKGCPVKDR